MNTDNTTIEESGLKELALKRWSPRAFDSRSVEEEKLHLLFETARWAPSSRNAQPWRFIYATKENEEAFNGFLDSLMDGNKVWAQHAPVLLAVFARKTFEHNGKTYRHSWYDTGQAMGILSLQATELGLQIHQMGGFYADRISEIVGISDEYEPVVMAAIGYPGETDQLPKHLQERETAPRVRKDIRELVHAHQWNLNN